ncbi:MAG TPA: hypothetical protein PKA53_03370 [Sphingobacterium sp.]|nr:hypothetical protein [Sphingobacterium sp.]
MMRLSLLLLLLLSGIRALSQAVYSTNPDSATLFPTKHGTFENYAFVLNGKVIEEHTLVNHPGAKLNNVFPYAIKLEGQRYLGAVYFHTEEKYAPPVRYADDQAYFINGTQVSHYHFRMTEAASYNRIEKSPQDTTINGRLYKGYIHVHTDEDFFADRITLPELIEKYTGLSAEKVIVHWRSSRYHYTYEEDIGTIIRDHFPIYSFNISRLGVRAVEVDRIRLAEGERYIVHIVDNAYRGSKPKARLIFEDPLAVDTVFPCYMGDFDQTGQAIFTSTEIVPQPYQGKEAYLKKLSAMMNLPTEKTGRSATLDSITVQFIVLRDGMLASLESTSPKKSGHKDILTAIKKTACAWLPAIQGGRPVKVWRKMTIFYSKDRKGNIRSLDNLEYRYNVVPLERNALSPPRQVQQDAPDSAILFPTAHGTFENYMFILNGTMIEQHELANYPGARLGRALPYDTPRKDKYQGVAYFHTPWYPPSPADQYADDPAYFINGVQVSPYTIRASNVEEYIRIKRSEQDTVIDGTLYKDFIHIWTEEDFFANRIAMPEIIRKYTGLPLDSVIVHWRGHFINALNPGAIIHDHFPLYYIDPRGLQEVKVDRVHFAEGERYFVHLVGQGYRYSNFTEKGWRAPHRNYLVFNNPRAFDPAGPCYHIDFDTTGRVIHDRAKVESRPFGGEAVYLKKLSTIMGLSTDKTNTATTRDSITVQFIVLGNGSLTGLESISPRKPAHDRILQAIKQHSCVWSVAQGDKQPWFFRRKMVIFYRQDKNGNMQSLDKLEYRHDDTK